jgi:hypothetical protein
MIDVESNVVDIMSDAFHASYPDGFISDEYVAQPEQFPAVMVAEMDNTVVQRGIDNGAVEHFANVMYQVDVYSNKHKGRKAEARAIIKLLDDQFARLRFTRTFLNPVPNMNDATIYRMTARYTRLLSNEENL